MFNMCSAISIPEEEARRGTSRWRVVLLLLLLAALAYTSWGVYRQAVRAYTSQASENTLEVAGSIAEEVETEKAEEPSFDLHTFDEVVAPLFASEPSLAAVRLWSPYQQLTGEITRLSPQTPQLRETAVLPNLHANTAMLALHTRLADVDWINTVEQLQQLQNDQSDISDTLSQTNGPGDHKMLCVQLAEQQNQVLLLAQTLDSSQHLLGDTIRDMNVVLNELAEDEGAVAKALVASNAVEDDLSAALTHYRAAVSVAPGLPSALVASAPASKSGVARLLPAVTGQRVLVPLFLTDVNNQLAPAGYAEVLFFTHPAEALTTLGWKQYALPAGLLCLMLLLLCWPRARTPKES